MDRERDTKRDKERDRERDRDQDRIIYRERDLPVHLFPSSCGTFLLLFSLISL